MGPMLPVEMVCSRSLTFPNFTKSNYKSFYCLSVKLGEPIFTFPTGSDISAVSSAATTLKRLDSGIPQGFNLLLWATWFFELFSNDPIL